MYTVNKGPSKFVTKTRGGLTQNIEKFETIRKCTDNQDNGEFSVPRPVFQSISNRKSYQHSHSYNGKDSSTIASTAVISPQHEELVKFVSDSWNMIATSNPYDEITKDDGDDSSSSSSNRASPSTTHKQQQQQQQQPAVVYHNDPPSPALKDFGAFDLESWWGRRLFNNITKTL